MPDLSKHLARAKQAIERRAYDLAIEICLECQEVDPANLENHTLLIEAAKRRAKAGGGKGFALPTLSKDPHKLLSAAVKKMAKNPDLKTFGAAGDAARKVFESGGKSVLDVSILLYEEARGTGLFNEDIFWNLAHLHHTKFLETKTLEPLDKAIVVMCELERSMPRHPEALRLIKNWEAEKSMVRRGEIAAGTGHRDFRGQLAKDDQARRGEVMNRVIRSDEDALDVLAFLDEDLTKNPQDKATWVKKGDVLLRMRRFEEARQALTTAQSLDANDFVVTQKLGDLALEIQKERIGQARTAGQDVTALEDELVDMEIAELRRRIERQPTQMSHHFTLGIRVLRKGNVDEAAAEFQQSVHDPHYRKKSHFYLGQCFREKKLLDLARDQFTSCLSLIEDQLSDEFKETLYQRAKVNQAMGDRNAALEDLTSVVRVDLAFRDAAKLLDKLRSSGKNMSGG